MKLMAMGVVALLPLVATGLRAGVVVIPAALAGAEGAGNDTSPLGQDHEVRFQQVYGSSLLGGLAVGDQITGLTFRVNGFFDTGVAAQTVTNYEIRLSTSNHAPGALSMTFANNRGADEVVVRSGALVIQDGDFPGGLGAGPESFGAFIHFDFPFTYGGGDLLLEVAYMGFSSGQGADDSSNDPAGQQIFTSPGAGGFSKAVADYSEDGVFVTALEVNGGAVPEPASVLLMAAGLGALAWVGRRR